MTHTVLAHAKLNLSLRILAREAGGYHQIETLFCALELADEIAIEIGGSGIRLDVSAPPGDPAPAPDIGPPGKNLAWRAAAMFMEAHPAATGAQIRLVKRIPAGAGLGGGSSDAAAVLRTLNDAHGHPLSAQELMSIGARLGSDVPFFVSGARLALAWGRGGRIMPLPPLPSAPVLLVIPPERVSTADAYAATEEPDPAQPALIAAPAGWSDVVARNDFETSVFAKHPRLAELRADLERSGARIARMTGSGSVLFGVYDDVGAAESAAARTRTKYPDVGVVLTRTLA